MKSSWELPDPDARVDLAPPTELAGEDTTRDDQDRETESSSIWREVIDVRKTARYAGLSAIVIGVVAGLNWFLSGSTAVEQRAVTAVVSNPGTATAVGGAVVVDGEKGLIVAGHRGDNRAGDSYAVVVHVGQVSYTFSTIELARSDGGVLLQLIGLETVPVLADVIEELGRNGVDQELEGSLDMLVPSGVDAEGGRSVERIDLGTPDEQATIGIGSEVAGRLRSWEVVLDGREVTGSAIVGCDDDGPVVTVAPLGDLVEAVRVAREAEETQVAGPAPYRSQVEFEVSTTSPCT